MHRPRIAFALAALAVLGALASATPAGAEPTEEAVAENPEAFASPPDLIVAQATVTAATATEWEVRYTVQNLGERPTGSGFTNTVKLNDATVLRTRTMSAISGRGAASDTVRVPRNGCYVPISVTADSANNVAEAGISTSESNNTGWGVGLSTPTCSSQPRYRVKAFSFDANDESHFDGSGSDAPYWIMNSTAGAGTERTTNTGIFPAIDTADTGFFMSDEGCLWAPTCGSAAALPYGLGVSIQLWERDSGLRIPDAVRETGEVFKEIGSLAPGWVGTASSAIGYTLSDLMGWIGDDLLGTQTFELTPSFLAGRLRSANTYIDQRRTFCCTDQSAGAYYTLTIRITRVA